MVKSRAGKRGEGGLVQAGEIPLVKTLAKKFKPPSRAQLELVDAALAIQSEPDAAERAFIARQLVLCTLPHSDPGDSSPRWIRRTGNSSLLIQPGASIPVLLVPSLMLGVGSAFMWGPISSTATRNLPPRDSGAGAGVYNTTRQIGSVLG